MAQNWHFFLQQSLVSFWGKIRATKPPAQARTTGGDHDTIWVGGTKQNVSERAKQSLITSKTVVSNFAMSSDQSDKHLRVHHSSSLFPSIIEKSALQEHQFVICDSDGQWAEREGRHSHPVYVLMQMRQHKKKRRWPDQQWYQQDTAVYCATIDNVPALVQTVQHLLVVVSSECEVLHAVLSFFWTNKQNRMRAKEQRQSNSLDAKMSMLKGGKCENEKDRKNVLPHRSLINGNVSAKNKSRIVLDDLNTESNAVL